VAATIIAITQASIAPNITDELIADYAASSRRALHTEALDLACIGSLAQMGFRNAVGAFATGPEPPDVAAAQLDWWVARVAQALGRLGSI
jgi:hypothetical protein